MTNATVGQLTQAALQNFAQNIVGGTESGAYQMIYGAIQSSPDLAFNLEQDLQIGVLQGFKPTFDTGVGGQYRDGYIEMPVFSSTGLLQHPLNLVFILAHEDRHALHAKSSQDKLDDFKKAVDSLAALPGVHDYTSILLDLQTEYSKDEALANIAAWNSVVSYVNNNVKNPSALDYRYAAGSYADYFVTAGGAPANNLLQFNSDYSISATQQSVSAEADLYFFNSATKLGAYGVSYPTWYILNNLKYILSVAGTDTVQIDMQALRVDGIKIKQANLLNLSPNQIFSIYDPKAHVTLEFTGRSNDGTILKESHPVILVDGEENETTIYDESNSVVSVSHEWSKSDGSHGNDFRDVNGNSSDFSVDSAGNTSWHFKQDGSYGEGASGTTYSRQEVHNADGSVNINNRNDVTGERYSFIHNTDGTSYESATNLDGSTMSKSSGPSGYSETHNYSDGSNSYITSSVDGSYFESKNYATGANYAKTIKSNGSITIVDNEADGSHHSSYENPDGSYGYADYNADGTFDTFDLKADQSSRHLTKYSNGDVLVEADDGHDNYVGDTYHSDSSHEHVAHSSDGSSEITKYNAQNIGIFNDIHCADGSERLYDNNGSRIYELITLADGSNRGSIDDSATGSKTEFSTTADGEYDSVEKQADGTTIHIHDYPEGFHTKETQYADGSHLLERVDPDGATLSYWMAQNGDYRIEAHSTTADSIKSYIDGRYNEHSSVMFKNYKKTVDAVTDANYQVHAHFSWDRYDSDREDIDETWTGTQNGNFHVVSIIGGATNEYDVSNFNFPNNLHEHVFSD